MLENTLTFLAEKGFAKFDKKEKFYLLSTILAIAEAGQDEKKAIYSKIKGYKKNKQFHYVYILEGVKSKIERGMPFAEALHTSGILTDREFHILKTSKNGLASGIEKIIEHNENSSKFFAGLLLAIVPPGLILILLLASQPAVYEVLTNMTKPIVEAGGTPPPINPYLRDRTYYGVITAIYLLITSSIVIFFILAKKYRPRQYWKLFPIIEEEYVLDILKSIKSVSEGGGINLADTAKALAMGEKDPIKKDFFEEIKKRTSVGKEKLSEVFASFGANYNTITLLEIGEESNDFGKGLDMSIRDLEKKYSRDIKIFLKAAFWIGQFSMIGIAIKPIIDIMLLMSISQLNFEV